MPEIYENYMMKEEFDGQQDYDPMLISSTNAMSLYNNPIDCQFNFNSGSPMSTTSSPSHMPTYLLLDNYTVVGVPHIVILEQPVEKFRFRYKSEMIGTHGTLSANSVIANKKGAPTVELRNFREKAIIRCTVVTSDDKRPRIPHAHHLIRRNGQKDRDDPHEIEVSQENGYTAIFYGMGIIHTAKRHVKDELIRKLKMELLEKRRRKNVNAIISMRDEVQIKADAEIYQKSLNLNSVSLCFQAFILDANNVMVPITQPVYSNPINNLKSALTGELKICRIDKFTSSCEGGEEVFMLVEKVGKKNIKVKFFELDEDDHEVWCDYGRFTELDVHHQYAIVFRTPPYKDINITSSKEVFVKLERPSDNDYSEAVKFTYKPSDRSLGRKRPRMSYSNSTELSQFLPTVERNDSFLKLNDSREISNELKKIFSEGCSSAELRQFVNNIDLDMYTHLVANSEEGVLTSDGASSTKKSDDDTMFAKDIFMEAISIINSGMNEANGEINPSKKKQLKNLFMHRSTFGDSPLHVALRHGQFDIFKYILILTGIDSEYETVINIQNSTGNTPLHYAVLQNQPAIIKALLELGADPNTCDDRGLSPLHVAVKIHNGAECVDTLLSSKLINTEGYTDLGWTPLLLAAEAGSYDAVCSLIRAGANVNNTDKSYGRSVLHIAVEGGHKEIVEFLLKNTSIDVNKTNFTGNTALHIAVAYAGTRAKELCKLLMEYGADPNIQNNSIIKSENIEETENQSEEKEDEVITIKSEVDTEKEKEGEIVKIKSEVDTEKEKEGEVVKIKSEVDSEEESEEKLGQTSFDLATNKPEILQVLKAHDKNTENDNNLAIITKEEILDEDIRKSWLSNEDKRKFALVLEKSTAWKKLAKHLDIEFLIDTARLNSLSPTLLILNYIDIQGDVSLQQLHDILIKLKEPNAAKFVSEIIKEHESEYKFSGNY
ncbi:PREDICTED: nuclear factor NF-kappa-B p100 subunit isoform X2 [Polistes dominula]|uniref:Nuclear factor NF-kappa-B p100 subunit isoform X2 n=1 Tax=Polistes dominula TaxID=743375 RepID=A0ABM1I986_POLDO|nr:PREDICTED: nuclear factor NF-kappa-B p100 subunit isoform X2 [Polistes dominula]